MQQHYKVTLVLCGIWMVTLLYGEMLAFWLPSSWSCSWPHVLNPGINGGNASGDYVKIAVITDVQLMDKTSHDLPPKSLVLGISEFYTDLYMRRAFFESVLPFDPDVVLFLGDFFDGGPNLSDEEWQESLQRFKHIFGLNVERRQANFQYYSIPGNHDIGYASIISHKPVVLRRYEKEFGSRNYHFAVGKVEFVAVDAQTLDGHSRDLSSSSWEFIKNVSTGVQWPPRVLLTHIPLYRPDDTFCGPHRNSPVINQRTHYSADNREISYQNYVTEESSSQLLELIKPVLVLSGHDHDQCTVIHNSKFGRTIEQTLGTFSWQMGNLYPSFMLLSASNSPNASISSPEEAVLTQLCFLPMQTHIYMWYLSLFVITIATILFWPRSGVNFGHPWNGFMSLIRLYSNMFREGTKEKVDEDCEYDMVWDAEGTMHLVKKPPREMPLPLANDKASMERGNAVMRSTAKKVLSQDSEFRMNIDSNAGGEFDPLIKLSLRTSKSRTRIVIRRLVRTFLMVSVIAAINVPIYMMLLFKDWVDK